MSRKVNPVPDRIFSAARLRGYRLLEAAGVADAVSLQITNTLLAAQLWLPYSLIEIAFRNKLDGLIRESHPSKEDWLLSTGRDGAALIVAETASPPEFHFEREDGSTEDPIYVAARTASRVLQRERISRDDIIAHLMLGFWVNRCPDALATQGFNVYDLAASEWPAPLNDPFGLRRTMRDHVLSTRNRVAHHEPLLFKKKHLFLDDAPRTERDMVVAVLEGAFKTFRKEVRVAVDTATAMVPQAAGALGDVSLAIEAALKPLEQRLMDIRERMKAERRKRIADERAAKGLAYEDP